MSQIDALEEIRTPADAFLDRKMKGIYYSPPDVAMAMVMWAIRNKNDTVFDPSFGGCVFLESAVNRLRQLGASAPERRTAGVDIDDNAWSDAAKLIEAGALQRHFLTADFLEVQPRNIDGPFKVVIGNPPYVRHHRLDLSIYKAAQESIISDGFSLSGRASYWAYFVLHAMRFVAPEGRLALILPGAVLHADYAKNIRKALRDSFDEVSVIIINERIFAEAEEESVIVLGEGYGGGKGVVRVGHTNRKGIDLDANSIHQITRKLAESELACTWYRGIIDPSLLRLYNCLAEQCTRLGNQAQIHIGAVTGAKKYFVLTDRVIEKYKIEKTCLKPIIAKASQLHGLVLKKSDIVGRNKKKEQPYLFSPPVVDCPAGASAYIKWGESEGFQNGSKCLRRKQWYLVPDIEPPDAFLMYMAGSAVRLVLNKARIPCTNTLYAVNWRISSKNNASLIACAMLSSITQLSAELEGRSYGGGMLKLEPSDAARLVLPIEALRGHVLLSNVDNLCRLGKWEEATDYVDDILSDRLINPRDMLLIKRTLAKLRAQRMARREKKAE